MNKSTPKPKLSTQTMGLVSRLAGGWRAERVILFGSQLGGRTRVDSDVDLLVILHTALEAEEVERRRRQLCAGQFPRVDLVVSSLDELREARGERAAFLQSVLEHGHVLHQCQPAATR